MRFRESVKRSKQPESIRGVLPTHQLATYLLRDRAHWQQTTCMSSSIKTVTGGELPGFTLLELVITLVVLTILLLIAVPTFDHWQARQDMNASLHALHQDLLTARSHAIMLGAHVVACPGDVSSGCSGDSDWTIGWLVFQDIDGNRQAGPTEPLIRQSPPRERMKITSSGFRTSFRFYANGTAPGSNGSIWLCGRRGPQNAQRLVVSNVGRIRREDFDGLEPEDCPSG